MIVSYASFIRRNGYYGQMAILQLLLERCLKKESSVISKIKDKTAPKGARLHEFFVKLRPFSLSPTNSIFLLSFIIVCPFGRCLFPFDT